jgi:hypothetical protein
MRSAGLLSAKIADTFMPSLLAIRIRGAIQLCDALGCPAEAGVDARSGAVMDSKIRTPKANPS